MQPNSRAIATNAAFALLYLLVLAIPGASQPKPPAAEPRSEVTVTLPATIAAKPGRLLRLEAQTTGKHVRWLVCSENADLIPFPNGGHTAIFSSPTPGRYMVFAWSAAGDVPTEAAQCIVVVGDPAPPGPGPNPPGPGPSPPPVPPSPVSGFRVLMIWERQDSLTRGQDAAVYGRSVVEYLNAKTVKDNGQPSWRRWDRDTDVSKAPTDLRLLWEAVQGSSEYQKLTGQAVVAIAVNNQVTVYPIPDSAEAMLTLLKKHGGE